MKSSVPKHNEVFDLIIVGAGINGAGVFRDAALNGLKVLLIDSQDLCTQTSARSSKLLHGGIRYLQTLDFSLVAEALQEKNLWLKLAPQLTRQQAFVLPIYQHSPNSLLEMFIGMKLYDLLSGCKDPHPTTISKDQLLNFIPHINSQTLKGAGLYYDGVVDDKGLAILCIEDGIKKSQKAKVLTHCELTHINYHHHDRRLLECHHLGQKMTLQTEDLVFCTGPFTDELLPKLQIPWKKTLALSKGSHLWLRKDLLPLQHAVVMQDKAGRVIFLIPYPDKLLLGTTELPLSSNDSLLNITISPEEVNYLKERFQEYFPMVSLTPNDILGSYCGIRPLVNLQASNEESGKLGKISRHHHLFHPHPQITVLLGGKYTTFRTMSQDVMQYVTRRQNRIYNNLLTLNAL
jgi:glycerol-3-phosphate dehydrogenase